jgi:hypothetical protein
MRLRALRVTVDVGRATGALTIGDAAEALEARVPMDTATAHEERLVRLDLQQLHDAIWFNGKVPVAALLRWSCSVSPTSSTRSASNTEAPGYRTEST